MSTSAAVNEARGSTRWRLSEFTDVLRFEWCKLFTVRSTFWLLFSAVVANVGLAAVLAVFLPQHLSAEHQATLDPVRVSLGGIHISQIAFAALGVLVITSEYSSGMIRATLSAVPQRRRMLAAKALVFALLGLAVGVISSLAAYFVFQGARSGSSLRSSIGDPGVLRAVIGGGLFLTTLGLLGLGLGSILRSGAGAISAVLGLLLVPPLLLDLLPQTWKTTVGPYVPMQAGNQIYLLHRESGALGPWTGYAVFVTYAVVALGVGFVVLVRRDA